MTEESVLFPVFLTQKQIERLETVYSVVMDIDIVYRREDGEILNALHETQEAYGLTDGMKR